MDEASRHIHQIIMTVNATMMLMYQIRISEALDSLKDRFGKK